MTPGETYLAPNWEWEPKGVDLPQWWRVEVLSRPSHGGVRVRWLAGPLAGREARLVAKTLREVR